MVCIPWGNEVQIAGRVQEKSSRIVVLDEIDGVLPRREEGAGGDVEKREVATLLTLLDGMENGDGRAVVIGTTNRPNAIDDDPYLTLYFFGIHG